MNDLLFSQRVVACVGILRSIFAFPVVRCGVAEFFFLLLFSAVEIYLPCNITSMVMVHHLPPGLTILERLVYNSNGSNSKTYEKENIPQICLSPRPTSLSFPLKVLLKLMTNEAIFFSVPPADWSTQQMLAISLS